MASFPETYNNPFFFNTSMKSLLSWTVSGSSALAIRLMLVFAFFRGLFALLASLC